MIRQYILVMVVLLVVCSGVAPARSEDINVTSLENWYPFSFTQDNHVRGLLYDIVNKACESLGINAVIEPVPIKRAIAYARDGDTDGVITGFRPEWAQFLDYPPETSEHIESPWRIMQVDDVVVSFAGDNYEFEGDVKTLPLPVRVLTDAPIIDELKKAGLRVEEVKEDLQNFQKLVRDEKGVIITSTVMAEMMERDPRFTGKIKIHATPVDSNSYYLAFSKKSSLSPQDKENIWKEIVRWRDDYIFTVQMFSQY